VQGSPETPEEPTRESVCEICGAWLYGQMFDPNKDVGGDMVTATTFGLTYFFDPKHHPRYHGAKIQVAYNIYDIGSIAPATPTGFLANGNELTAAFQVDF
jgi:hypothetical protein